MEISAHIPAALFFEHIDFLKSNDIGAEYYPDADFIDSGFSGWHSVKRGMDSLPSRSIHAPFYEFNPGSRDSKIRDTALLRFNQTLKIAKRLNVKQIVFHTGYFYYMCRGEKWLENSKKFWEKARAELEKNKIKIAFENVFEFSPEPLYELINFLKSDNIGFCFDAGHFNIFSKEPLKNWLDALGADLIEIHIHDNFGFDDEHKPPGLGNFNFDYLFSYLKKIGKTPYITVENRTREEVLMSADYLKKCCGQI